MKSFFKKIKNKIKMNFCFKTINPHKHWRSILVVFLILIIVVIIFDLYLLYKINNNKMYKIAPKANEASIPIDDKLLKKTNEYFDQKLIKEKELRNIIE